MSSSIQRILSPEEEELVQKKAKLSALEPELANLEEELASLQFILHSTQRRYLATVGLKLAELDRVTLAIAECLHQLHPENTIYSQQSQAAREKSAQSAYATENVEESQGQDPTLEPSENLKALFRTLAKKVHPDFAKGEQDLQRRNKAMAAINDAYQRGDAERLREILNDWENSADNVVGDGIGAELIRVIRQIAAIQQRIDRVKREIEALKQTELFDLYTEVDAASRRGRDLFAEMAADIVVEIARKQEQLKSLREALGEE